MCNQYMNTGMIATRGRIKTWNSERRDFKLSPEKMLWLLKWNELGKEE